MRRRGTLLGVLVGAIALLLPAAALAQSAEAEVDIVDLNLLRYSEGGRVSMVVEFRQLAEPLDPAQLQITVNGEPINEFEVEPLSASRVAQGVVLVIDKSGSMEGAPIEAAKAAAKSFVEQKRPEDFIALVTFDTTVNVLSSFTNSATALNERIDSITAGGDTAMFDAVVRGTELYATATENLKRNMIILTDGQDDGSTGTVADAVAAVEAAGVRTFGVALESDSFTAVDLAQIVEAGNGVLLTTTDPAELANLYGQIQRELNNSLVVRFTVPESNPVSVDFGVQYGSLSAQVSETVPGYVTTTTSGPTTTATFTPATPVVIEGELPLPASTMRVIVTLALFLAVLLLLFILLGGNRDEKDVTFTKRLAAYGRRGPAEEKKPLMERIPLLGRFSARAEEEVRRRGLLGAVNSTLEQGNIPLKAGEAVAAAFGLAAIFGLIVGVVTLNLITGGIAFAVAILFVFAVIKFIGGREKKRFENQLPDTLTLISTSLRAGYSLLQAVEAVAQEAPNPTAREFGRAIAEARLGRPVTEALDGITQRTQSEDFRWAVMAIEIQREVGGNLSEVLQTVADTMRSRNQLKGEIRALTAEGRISAIVLGSLPFAMGLFLWTTNRDYLEPMFQHTFGLVAMGIGLLLISAGIVWLRKIINIEV